MVVVGGGGWWYIKSGQKTTTTITITVFLVPRGGKIRVLPAICPDRLRGGRKGDPQH